MRNTTITDNTITFEGESYPCNWVDDPYGEYEDCQYLIATTALLGRLFDSECNPTSQEAQSLDERILFYVDDSKFTSDSKLLLDIVKAEMV